MSRDLRQYLSTSFLLIFFLLFDGSMMHILSVSLKEANYQIVPAFTFIAIILLALYVKDDKFLFSIAMIIGFIYDAYYMSILGVNIFLFPLGVVVTRYIATKMPLNFYSIWFWSVISYVVYSHILYLLYFLIDIHKQGYGQFITNNLIPGLLFNALFIFICHWFINRLVLWMEKY